MHARACECACACECVHACVCVCVCRRKRSGLLVITCIIWAALDFGCHDVAAELTACDGATHCSGHGATFDPDSSDGCVCFCDAGHTGGSCEVAAAAPTCPAFSSANPGGLTPGFEHYTSLGKQGLSVPPLAPASSAP